MAQMLSLAVGQEWRTRKGAVVRIAVDRQEFAVVPRWRWACSNGEIVDDYGRAGAFGASDPNDLVQLVKEVK